jgi:hypothetical protein
VNTPPFEQWLHLLESTSKKLATAPVESRFELAVPEIFRSLTASLQRDGQRWLDLQNRYYQKQWA